MRSKRKIAAAALLAFVICLLAPGISAFADGGTVYVSTLAELQSEIDSHSTVTIVLEADLSDVSGISVGGSKNVTLLGNGHTITFNAGDSCLDISGNAMLNLGAPGNSSSILYLTKNNSGESPGVLSISGNATVNMYDGVTIKDAKNNNYYGGGVTIGGQSSASNKAVFHMYGGTIYNCGVDGGSVCYGGGVSVCNGGTFIMDGGTISNCYATTTYYVNPTSNNATGCGGAVFVGSGSTFVMNGGSIRDCEASSNGGGVAVYASYQSGLGYMDSEFTMNGGIIIGCTAGSMGGGVFATGRYVNSAAICAPTGSAGTVTNKGIHILGGTISNNDSYEYGGGIGLFLLSRNGLAADIKNTNITGNSSYYGGGIGSVLYWTHFNVDNCSITGNSAQVGGGIAIDGYDGSNAGNKPIATVTNSSIGNNTADACASDVYVYDAEMHLCSAENAGIVYTSTAPTDLTNRVIEQWYEDNYGDRFADQASTARVAQTELNFAWSSKNEIMLIAAPTPESPYGADKAYFDLYKYFYGGYGNDVSGINEKVFVNPTFTITKLKSFNRVTGMDPNNFPEINREFPAIPGSYTIQVSSGLSSVTIPLPDYSAAGVGDYWYTVTESNLSGIAGLSNDAAKYLHVQVVWYDDENETLPVIGSIRLHTAAPDDNGAYADNNKTPGFTNTYNAGSLEITKQVTGNMADPDKLFAVTVKFTAPGGKTIQSPISCTGGFDSAGNAFNETIPLNWSTGRTVTVYLKHGSTVTFSNIPAGVSYTITEDPDGYSAAYAIDSAETETGDSATPSGVEGTISDLKDTVTITNTKSVNIDVGVTLDNAPFVILLSGGVVILAVLLLAKRRKKNVVDEDI